MAKPTASRPNTAGSMALSERYALSSSKLPSNVSLRRTVTALIDCIDTVGVIVVDGAREGLPDGISEGLAEGLAVGSCDGIDVGFLDGF